MSPQTTILPDAAARPEPAHASASPRPPSPAVATATLPADMFKTLADRFRPAGLMVAVLGADGSLAQADVEAASFFQRYVVPALRQHRLPAGTGGPVAEVRQADNTDAPAAPEAARARYVPGVSLAGFARVDNRQAVGMVVVAGREHGFDLSEDVLRTCGRLGLDARWVASLAEELPAYGPATLERQARLLMAMAGDQARLAGMNREVNSLSQQLADTYEELTLIYQLSGGMKVNRGAGDFFKQACLDVMEVMDVRGMGVALSLDVQNCPEPALYGQVPLSPEQVARLAADLMADARQRKGPLRVDRVSHDPRFAWLGSLARQMLVVPLQRQDQVLGCLFAIDKRDGDFDSVDSKLLGSIADESGVYLENATLFEDVHGLMMGLLHSLTSAVDAKDSYTCGHSERVALLSRNIAQLAGLPTPVVEQVYMSGLLHDVGKIGVPESVLQKAGRLTAEEFEQMKKHPEVGARILADVKQLKPILPGVLHHHERFDGKGYPHGLAGENIPVMGRIICLADCFDAMTSNRTYRRALPIEVAMTEIRRCAGTQFDPALAEAFLKSTPDALRELLRDHKERSKRLIEMQETLRGK